MLDQLVESKNHSGESRRRGSFLLSTFTGVFSLFTLALIYSLFSYNLAMAGENLDLSSLVAPVTVAADEPPPPEKVAEPKQQNTDKATDKLQTRVENMQRVSEVPVKVPPTVSTQPNANLARPNEPFTIGTEDSLKSSSPGNGRIGRASNGNNLSVGIETPRSAAKIEDEEKPPVKTPAPKVVPKTTVPRSVGVVNGQAINLVKPSYPIPAKMVHASGAVNVQVTIDENGNVTAASALSGHPLLRQVSEQAARASKFSPTLLGAQKVKVTGVIVYNFIAQ